MGKALVGIQLYTLREFVAKDFAGTLRRVKMLGYDGVEFAGYCGYTATEIKKMCSDAGLEMIGAHFGLENFENDLEGSVSYHAELGVKYVAIPWMSVGRCPGGELYEETKKLIESAAGALSEKGICFMYHNHDFEFYELPDGALAYDRLFEEIPGLYPEFDTCWLKYAGYDPVKYIEKYRGRTPVIHLKDYVGKKGEKPVYALIDKDGKAAGEKEAGESGAFAFRPLGEGILDVPAIVRIGMASGAEAFIYEQDECYGDAWGAAERSINYLRSIGL
jgi:sugar phosphate isomerase/epimerase